MVTKGGIALLGAYLLGKKLLPQGGLVRAEDMDPTNDNIKFWPLYTTLYGKPTVKLAQLVSDHAHEFEEDDSQQQWHYDADWDGMLIYSALQPLNRMKIRNLHFYADFDTEDNGRTTARGENQLEANITMAAEAGGSLQQKDECLVGGVPVNRMDPPHSDVAVPRGHDAKADFWMMEYAFRKLFHRYKKERGGITRIQTEIWLRVPKNLIAYFVQRAMQFPPETFGRFRISDGSHTHVKIDYNGKPRVVVLGETSHILKLQDKKGSDLHNISEDVGLDVPVAENEDLGGGDSAQIGDGSEVDFTEDCEDEVDDDCCDESCEKIRKLN